MVLGLGGGSACGIMGPEVQIYWLRRNGGQGESLRRLRTGVIDRGEKVEAGHRGEVARLLVRHVPTRALRIAGCGSDTPVCHWRDPELSCILCGSLSPLPLSSVLNLSISVFLSTRSDLLLCSRSSVTGFSPPTCSGGLASLPQHSRFKDYPASGRGERRERESCEKDVKRVREGNTRC